MSDKANEPIATAAEGTPEFVAEWKQTIHERNRFHAACFAMAGLLANPNLTRAKDISQTRNCDAGNALLAPVVNIEGCAVQLADHLLAALNKPVE